MAVSLPSYPAFDCSSDGKAVRWNKWTSRLNNLFVGYDVKDNARKKALLLTFGGDDLNDLVETIPAAKLELAEGENCYDKLVSAIKDIFNPIQNTEFQRYSFRNTKQTGDSIMEYYTVLKQIGETCSFQERLEEEVKSQLIAGCKSSKVRQKGLSDSTMTLTKLLDYGRTLELTEAHSRVIEGSDSRHTAHSIAGKKPQKQQHRHFQRQQPQASGSQKCRHCGGAWPHNGGQQNCPASGWMTYIFWFIISLAIFRGFVTHNYFLFVQYWENDVDVTTGVTENNVAGFPAVTVCNLNRIKSSYWDALLNKTDEENKLLQTDNKSKQNHVEKPLDSVDDGQDVVNGTRRRRSVAAFEDRCPDGALDTDTELCYWASATASNQDSKTADCLAQNGTLAFINQQTMKFLTRHPEVFQKSRHLSQYVFDNESPMAMASLFENYKFIPPQNRGDSCTYGNMADNTWTLELIAPNQLLYCARDMSNVRTRFTKVATSPRVSLKQLQMYRSAPTQSTRVDLVQPSWRSIPRQNSVISVNMKLCRIQAQTIG